MDDNVTGTPEGPLQPEKPSESPPPPPPPPPTGSYTTPPNTPAPPAQPGYGAAPPSGTSPRMVAALIAILAGVVGLGWIGGHKFYLGYTKEGVIYLLGSILTCGLGAVVFNVVSIIEGIIYLTKTDPEFNALYVTGHKPWF